MKTRPEDADLPLVDPERRASAVLDRLTADSRKYSQRRDRSFSAREALACLEFEALVVAVAASNLAQGVELTDEDRRRLWLASSRVTTIAEEALG